jgi:ABC-type transporter Mla MlaB component
MARDTVVWDASPLPAEIATVDALARLTLLARRQGAVIQLRGVSPELRELIDLAGLARVISMPHPLATLLAATSPWCFRHQP